MKPDHAAAPSAPNPSEPASGRVPGTDPSFGLRSLAQEVRGIRSDVLAALNEVRSLVTQSQLQPPQQAREGYSVEEVAELLGKRPYSVREWCRLGRIHAAKCHDRRGSVELWRISAAEIARYQDNGLLDLDPKRNR